VTHIFDKNISGLSCITNELEEEINIYLKLFVLLYAGDTVLFSETKEGLLFFRILSNVETKG